MAKGKFTVESNKAKRTILLTFSGFFNTEDTETFGRDYTKAIQEVGQSNTTLLIVAEDLMVFPQDKRALAIEFYKDYGKFKEIYITKPKSAVAYMQLETDFQKAGILDKAKFVDKLPSM